MCVGGQREEGLFSQGQVLASDHKAGGQEDSRAGGCRACDAALGLPGAAQRAALPGRASIAAIGPSERTLDPAPRAQAGQTRCPNSFESAGISIDPRL